MNEQMFNIKFVGEVEKFPVLYNFKLKDYAKKEATEKAWSEVATICNLSITECKEKWKNLRSVFVRRLKGPPPGSSHKIKPYYLSEAMQFTLPYVRTAGKPDGYLAEAVSQQGHFTDEEEDSVSTPQSSVLLSFAASSYLDEPQSPPLATDCITSQVLKKNKRNEVIDVDQPFIDYIEPKRQKVESQPKDVRARKRFLDSLLPEIATLTEEQMRSFRRKVLQLIDDIRLS